MHWWLILVSAVIGGLVWTGIAYPGLSQAKRWPAGDWARSENWAVLFWFAVAFTLMGGFIAGGILGVLIVIAVAGPLTFGLTELLKERVQLPARIACWLAFPWCLAAFFLR